MPTFSSNILHPSQALLRACENHGFSSQVQQSAALHPDSLLLFEASQRPATSLDAPGAAGILESLRRGGRLLFTYDDFPGHSAYWLSEALPSTGWTSQRRPSSYDPQIPTQITAFDDQFFHGASLDGLAAQLGVDIRPVSAAERGQSRYERYQLQHPYIGTTIAPNSDLWSRPLLNREWKVRACYDTIERFPLLVTGRYGAGKVAMLATTSAALGESVAAQAFWIAVISWLNTSDTPSRDIPDIKPSLAVSFPSSRIVRITISNPSNTAAPVRLVTRMLDGNGAMLADGSGEFEKPLTLLPKQSTVLDRPLPALSKAENGLQVRAGLLSGDGALILTEQRETCPSSPFRISVTTENIHTAHFPFPGPNQDSPTGFQNRMGLATFAYAYQPETSVQGTVSVQYKCMNLAPRARVEDLTQPGNPSVTALNDGGASIRHPPADHINGYGTWGGKAGTENALLFTFPEASSLSAVVLIASYGNLGFELHNPGQAIIEVDDVPVARIEDLDSNFTNDLGQARIELPQGTAGTRLKVRLPYIAKRGAIPRQEPWLGEIEVEGWPSTALSAAVNGQLTVELVDAMNGDRRSLVTQQITLSAGKAHREQLTVMLPPSALPSVYRIEGSFHPEKEQEPIVGIAPVLSVSPRKTLRSIEEITGPNVFGTGMLVTNGFTLFFQLATGTSEPWHGWGHPDDLVWAYSRQFKEIPGKAHTAANRLYATQSDMRHYSMPWREFGNGELFFETATPSLVQHLKQQNGWNQSQLVRLNFSDRWVVGPDLRSCNGWQEYIAFDSYLRRTAGKGLDGRTHEEVETSLHTDHENEWQAWQLGRYVDAVRAIREAFHAEGKDVVIYSQDIPSVAGPAGRDLALTIRGMNDDYTWGLESNSPNLTTGRTLGTLAFNPVWQMNTLLPWGFVSSVFNNWQWHSPVGTAEPIRRLLYNRLWRGTVWDGGAYSCAITFGYSNNVGVPYSARQDEYQEWWNVQQRGSLIQPESPLGAGLVISTQKSADPRSTRWNGNDPSALPEIQLMMAAFRSLTEAGISVPFTTNASTLASWKPTPGASLIVLNLQDFSSAELSALAHLQQQGVRIGAFAPKASLSSDAASLFSRQGTLLLETSAAGLTHAQALGIAAKLIETLEIPVRVSSGFGVYGFRSQGLNFVVVEDWLEAARDAKITLRKSQGTKRAVASNLNDHSTLHIADLGAYWEVTVPMRSADAALIAVREA